MNREEIKKAAVDTVVAIAKEEAGAVLKLLNTDEVKELLKAQMVTITVPLEQEIKTTDSLWVKVRNRLYIIVLNKAVDDIVEGVKKKIGKTAIRQQGKISLLPYFFAGDLELV